MNIDALIHKYGNPPKKHKGFSVQAVANPGHVIDVVGEYYRKASVEAAIDQTGGVGWAVLVPEPDNKHDHNAISVWVGSRKIGFIEADMAAEMQPKLLELRRKCGQALSCPVEFEDNWAEQETSQAFLILDAAGVIGAEVPKNPEVNAYPIDFPPRAEAQPFSMTVLFFLHKHWMLITQVVLATIAIAIAYRIIMILVRELRSFIRIMFW